MISQVIRFTLQSPLAISGPEFLKLRQDAAAAGATSQYFGHKIPVRPFSHPKVPKPSNEIVWAIQWPDGNKTSLASSLAEIIEGDATYVEFQFTDEQVPHINTALDSPVSEFAFIRFLDEVDIGEPKLQESVVKGYSNSFKMKGFLGGQWTSTINTTNPDGESYITPANNVLPEDERRLMSYFLGWQSLEDRIATTETEIFAEELGKLMPYCGSGTGAWYSKFERHA